MNTVQQYYSNLRDVHRSGGAVPETSYYPALQALLNEVGRTLKPRATCIINLANSGAGLPDGGIFSEEQLRNSRASVNKSAQIPERGAIEVKPPTEDARGVMTEPQGKKYLAHYGLLLVTNLREFVLFERGDDGIALEIDSYELASDADSFWMLVDHPSKTSQKHRDRLPEFLRRTLTRKTRLADPADVAWFLASYARDAKAVIEHRELETLAAVRSALEQVLGLKFDGAKGDRFFKSTLVQTLFYGLFAAWVMWCRRPESRRPGANFDWRMTEWDLAIPLIGTLFGQVANAQQLKEEDLRELITPLDRAAATLNRVDRAAFFTRFAEAEAVQYFYEPFLEAFDPELRKSLGVWYTPREVVRYMVERVDATLRSELGIQEGLANEHVYVLDPCCGTGAFLIEVLQRIERTLRSGVDDALVGSALKKAARDRVFGFEIMPAPFVVAHLQLGLLLESLGAPLRGALNERVGVYLTNALTGWEPSKAAKSVLFKDLAEERDAAEDVKRNKPILVILGNPPYNAFAGVGQDEEEGLVEPYKRDLRRVWNIRKFNLDELYVRFFRIAEQRIIEGTGKGLVCFISNYSYLSEASFVALRERMLQGFDRIWIDCLNGDSRETGKLTPDGESDPSVFSTEQNPEGIRVGTAVGLFVRKDKRSECSLTRSVMFRDFWGRTKRADLLKAIEPGGGSTAYTEANPTKDTRYAFVPSTISGSYAEWPKLNEIAAVAPITGYKENRGFSLIDDSRSALSKRMRSYLDRSANWEDLVALGTGLTKDAARFNARAARDKVLAAEEKYSETRELRYLLRPFEMRWCYYCPTRPLWNEPRPSLYIHHAPGNAFLVSRPAGVAKPEGVPFYFTRHLADFDFIKGHSYHFPLGLRSMSIDRSHKGQKHGFTEDLAPNLSASASAYAKELLGEERTPFVSQSELIWLHILAIGFSPAYLDENADGIRQDWPRVPLPRTADQLRSSAELGRQIASLLDVDSPVEAVDSGTIRAELKVVGVIARTGGGQADPDSGDLKVDVGWGHVGKDGVTMPGRGKLVQRNYTDAERAALIGGGKDRGLSESDTLEILGPGTYDVHLNPATYWRNVPIGVWDYVIGGYQVIKKWLSYREHDLLGRSLTIDETRYVTKMTRRLTALLLMRFALDHNYRQCATESYAWPRPRK